MRAARFGRSAMTARRRASPIEPHAAISSRLRRQPRQRPDEGSITQIFTQGVLIGAKGGFLAERGLRRRSREWRRRTQRPPWSQSSVLTPKAPPGTPLRRVAGPRRARRRSGRRCAPAPPAPPGSPRRPRAPARWRDLGRPPRVGRAPMRRGRRPRRSPPRPGRVARHRPTGRRCGLRGRACHTATIAPRLTAAAASSTPASAAGPAAAIAPIAAARTRVEVTALARRNSRSGCPA